MTTSGAGTFDAWVDESVHSAASMRQPVYLLAAAVADPGSCDPTRDALRALLLPKARRLHWRDESSTRRQMIADLIAEQDLLHTVVIGTPVDPRRQERARRLCMERLFFEMARLGVDRIWLESRTQSLNAQDRATIDAVRGKKLLPAHTFVDFARPREEPMLWIPDAVAGAIGAHRKGRQSGPREALLAGIDEIEIDLS